jgi:hypothetical protein
MKFLMTIIVGVVCCGCMSNDESQGGVGRGSSEQRDASSSQRENQIRNHTSDNVKNPSSNWNTP